MRDSTEGTYEKDQIRCVDCGTKPKVQTVKTGKKESVINTNDTLIKLLREQIKMDSLYFENYKKEQEEQAEVNRQNRQLIDNMTKLIDNFFNKDTANHDLKEKKYDEIQENIQDGVEDISENVEVIKKTLLQPSANSNGAIQKVKWKPKPLAFGIDVAGQLLYNTTQDNYRFYSPCVIFLSIIPQRNFKMEFEIAGTYSSVGDNDFFASVGLYGMWQGLSTNFYAGIKGMRFFNSKTNFIIPAIGGEYVFGERFSVGTEIGFPMCFDDGDFALGVGFNRVILRFYLGGKEKGLPEKNKK